MSSEGLGVRGWGLGARDWGLGIRDSGFGKHAVQASWNHCEPKRRFRAIRLHAGLATIGLILIQACGSKRDVSSSTPFPKTDEVAGWSKSGATRTFEAANLWEYIDGDAEKYLQAGVENTLTADYRYQNKVEAVADVYIMKTPEGARKIFESESSAGSQHIQLGDDARRFPATLSFRKGQYFVRLTAYQEAPEIGAALTELARAIERKLGAGS